MFGASQGTWPPCNQMMEEHLDAHVCKFTSFSVPEGAAQCGDAFLILKKFSYSRDFSGSQMVKTPSFQCWRPRFNPWSGN